MASSKDIVVRTNKQLTSLIALPSPAAKEEKEHKAIDR
jgi:hypothetical protein